MSSCRTCHFLCKDHVGERGDTYVFEIHDHERDAMEFQDHYSVGCWHKVWRSVNMNAAARTVILHAVSVERRRSCFYYPHVPGMNFPAAAELEHRQSENSKLEQTLRYTQIGLWIAGIGLIVNVIFEILSTIFGK